MQPKLLLLAFLLMDSLFSFSQQDTIKPPTLSASNIFLELGGNGLFISLNYDQRFSKRQNGLGGRVGIGFFPGVDIGVAESSTIIILPFGLNYLLGRGPSYFELGAGGTFVSGTIEFFDNKSKGSAIAFIPSFGYRYQPMRKGFIGRVFMSPLFVAGGSAFYAGISGGVKF